MIAAQTKFEARLERLAKAVERAKEGSIRAAAYLVRETAIDSIKISKRVRGYFWKTSKRGKRVLATYYEPSPVGQPVLGHRRGKTYFRRGIRYAVDKQQDDAFVGASHEVFETILSLHEHGLEGYAMRPVMQPALEANVDKFHSNWKASIG